MQQKRFAGEPDKWLGRANARTIIAAQKRELQAALEDEILAESSEGLCVKEVPGCGMGLFATKKFLRKDYICVYSGEYISEGQFKLRYHGAQMKRCYTYHFYHDSQRMVIDATNDPTSMARMANHSWKLFNAEMRRMVVRGVPRVVMFATQDIPPGNEIRYNYGDEVVKESCNDYPWLNEIKAYN